METPAKSELERFASFFHQDWSLEGMDFHTGAAAYFESLSPDRKATLKKQLSEFAEYRESQKAFKKAWFKLGAQAWQKDPDFKQTLHDFIAMLEE